MVVGATVLDIVDEAVELATEVIEIDEAVVVVCSGMVVGLGVVVGLSVVVL